MTTTKRRQGATGTPTRLSAPLSQLPPRKVPASSVVSETAIAVPAQETMAKHRRFDEINPPISEMPKRAMIARRQKELHSLSPSPSVIATLVSTASEPVVPTGTPRTGPELIDQIIQYPTLDILLDRDPHARPYSDQELEHLVAGERGRRALYATKLDKAKDKRQGIEEPTSEAEATEDSYFQGGTP